MFNKDVFIKNLKTEWLGKKFLFFPEIDSTQYYAKNLPLSEISEGTVIMAELQTEGHGQFKRNWDSYRGKNLMFTSIFTPDITDCFTVLTLACAIAIHDVLKEYIPNHHLQLKWPNDVMVDNKKIAGILTETSFIGNKLGRIAMGIGLNVNQSQYPNLLKDKATSLLIESGNKIGREKLLGDILLQLEINYGRWKKNDCKLANEINQSLEGYEQWVQLVVNDEILEGKYKFLGLNEEGNLHVLNEGGKVDIFTHEKVRIKTIP